ncbi:MAG: diacylglycerol O-acyltransferase [Glaciecola sp.]|jgi:diacylglycerol O-acyltransferase
MGDRLPLMDAGWLMVESRETPMHVAGLQLFTPPQGVPPTFIGDMLRNLVATHKPTAPFNQRLERPYGRAGMFHWTEDENIDLEYHVRHSALAAPGRIRELLALTSRLHSTLLDRHRPLWELHLIEGLNDGRVAVYTKFHHSLFDGVGAMRQILEAFSPDPERTDLPAPWAIEPKPRRARDRVEGGERSGASPLGLLSKVVGAPIGQALAAGGAGVALTKEVIDRLRGGDDPILFSAPSSILNGRISGSRRFAADSWSLERIKLCGKAHGATINDVVMAVCAGALRGYLDDLGELPDKPLVAMVPVSIRPEDSGDGTSSNRGNALSMLLADLATDEPDPVKRLARVKSSMDTGKARLKSMSHQELVDYALVLTAPNLVGSLTNLAGRTPPSCNLVISNVPGPREPLFWNGAKMDGMYPASLIPQGQALNITLTSYVEEIAFSVTADRKTLPSVQRLLIHFEEALAELEARA